MSFRTGLSALPLVLALSVACTDKVYQYDGEEDTAGADADGGDGGSIEDADGDGFSEAQGDCDDENADINPDATEMCDGADNDCDGVTDEQDAADVTTWYFDGDGDGYGDDDATAVGCDGFQNHVAQGGDCNDDVASAYPGATEICDGYDNDCNGEVDDGDIPSAPTWYYDGDGDDFGNPDISEVGCSPSTDYVDNGEDCDDSNAAINPDAADGTGDGIDDNCDGTPDDEASCNAYRPFGAGPTATRTFSTAALDGNSYTENVLIRSWSPSTGQAVLERAFVGASGNITVQETHRCDGAAVKMTGWVYQDASGTSATFTFSTPRTDLDDPSLMVPGYRWSYNYTSTDSVSGSSWQASGTMEVIGVESVTVTAGTFDALHIDNTYSVVDGSGTIDSRTGVASYWYVENLGPVKVLDMSGDTVNEDRELTAYTGFNP